MRANSYQQMATGSPRVLQLRSSRGMPSQAPRLPQQYAHPLMQRNDSFEHDSPSSSNSSTPHSSEHMLRRKTPNGVLSAAYDGTNMIQNGRPHPMKHILLPLTEANADTSLTRPHISPHDLPLRSPAHHHSSDAQLGMQQSRPQNQVWDPGVKNGFGPDVAWMSGPGNAQIDSMLNQIPMQQLGQFQQDGTFYGVMQPTISPPGPTISNDIGPYGPYWPNGTYIPYRPATVRDVRYYPQYSANWLSPIPTAVQGWSGLIKPQNLQYPAAPSANVLGMGPVAYDMSLAAGIYANDNSALGFGKPTLDNGPSYEIPAADSGQTTPRAGQTPIPSDFGPHSQNAQLRERVFEWAHSAYVNVLEYLKHTRRSANNNNRHIHGYHHAHRPNIYPKPPRQPSYDFQTHLNMRKSADTRPSYRLQQSHSLNSIHSDVSHKDATPTPSTRWPSQHVQDSRVPHQQQSWHSQMSAMTGNAYGPPRNLRRTSGPNSSITSLSSHSQTSPTAAAISALESLTELCQESAWQWVEGILLGGCLAYALCDYHKAMKWFSRILEIDARYDRVRLFRISS